MNTVISYVIQHPTILMSRPYLFITPHPHMLPSPSPYHATITIPIPCYHHHPPTMLPSPSSSMLPSPSPYHATITIPLPCYHHHPPTMQPSPSPYHATITIPLPCYHHHPPTMQPSPSPYHATITHATMCIMIFISSPQSLSVEGSIEVLLQRGADPNVSGCPLPPIVYAICAGDVKGVIRLLTKGARVHSTLPLEVSLFVNWREGGRGRGRGRRKEESREDRERQRTRWQRGRSEVWEVDMDGKIGREKETIWERWGVRTGRNRRQTTFLFISTAGRQFIAGTGPHVI